MPGLPSAGWTELEFFLILETKKADPFDLAMVEQECVLLVEMTL